MANLITNQVGFSSTDIGVNITLSQGTAASYLQPTTYSAALSFSKPQTSNLTPQEKLTLQQTIRDNLQNEIFTNINDNTLLQSKVDTIVNDWLKNNPSRKPTPAEEITVSTALAIGNPVPDISNQITGRGTGDKPYNPNVVFNNVSPADIERGLAQTARAKLLDPKSNNPAITSNTNSLVDTITGADLSIFFLTELPNINDVLNPDIPQHLYRKELMLIEIDSVLSATYSIMREVFPVRSVGRMKPKSFVRGPVTISGSLAFTIFTEDVLVRLRTQMQQSIIDLQKKAANVIQTYTAELNKSADGRMNNYSQFVGNAVSSPEVVQQQQRDAATREKIDAANKQFSDLTDNYRMYNQILNTGGIFMLNQLLPFHILIMGTTERGIFSKLMLKNIRVIDENQMQGVQQPNIVNRISFVAEDIFPLMSGNLNDAMSYSATADVDANRIGANRFGIYSGSQAMNDIAGMVSGEYRLKDSR